MGRSARRTSARLAEKLLFIRTRMLGLSQNELIRSLGFDGELIQSHISAFEQRNEKLRREPPLFFLLKIARVAKVSVESLIDDHMALEKLSARGKQRGGKSVSRPSEKRSRVKKNRQPRP